MKVPIISIGNKETCLHVALLFAKSPKGVRKFIFTIVHHAAPGNPSVDFFMDIPVGKVWFDDLDAGEDAAISRYKVASGTVRTMKLAFVASGKYRLSITNHRQDEQPGEPLWLYLETDDLRRMAVHGRDIIDHVERLWLTDGWAAATE